MVSRNLRIATAALGAAVASGTGHAAVVVDLTNPAGDVTTVTVGDTVTARISASTDSANGIAVLNARVTTSTASLGGAADTSPFAASVIPTNPSNTSSNQPVTTTFNPALAVDTIVTPHSTTFGIDGQPTSTVGNRPLSGFNGTTTNGRGTAKFFSADNAALTWFADVSFIAREVGTVYFSLLPNGPTASEYSAATGTGTTLVTPSIASGAGFTVTIVPVPEPAAVGLVAASCLGLLARRRRA